MRTVFVGWRGSAWWTNARVGTLLRLTIFGQNPTDALLLHVLRTEDALGEKRIRPRAFAVISTIPCCAPFGNRGLQHASHHRLRNRMKAKPLEGAGSRDLPLKENDVMGHERLNGDDRARSALPLRATKSLRRIERRDGPILLKKSAVATHEIR
jgi:hypothetical protein